MKHRFEGEEGYRLLLEALRKQDIIEHDEGFAAALAAGGTLVDFPSNVDLVVQGGADNSVFFLIAGEANVFVNNRFVGLRTEGTCIGEMAVIDSAAPRSATV
jgi:CRP/FNR family transcriptional regulator, cyclic AMP receptor protein